MIVVGSVVFVTAVVLVIVIVINKRRKPKIMFKTVEGQKEGVVDDILFQKSINNIHTEDFGQTDKAIDKSFEDNNGDQLPARRETAKL